MRGPNKRQVGLRQRFTEEQLVRSGTEGVEAAKSFMVNALREEARIMFPDGGMVLDASTVTWDQYDETQMQMRNLIVVEVRGTMVEHDRGPVITSMMDVQGFRTGTTFRDRRGHILALDDDGLVSIHLRYGPAYYPDRPAAVFPMTFLWEPKEEMSSGEIHRAEYDPLSGIPARVIDQMNAGVDMDSALIDGWL